MGREIRVVRQENGEWIAIEDSVRSEPQVGAGNAVGALEAAVEAIEEAKVAMDGNASVARAILVYAIESLLGDVGNIIPAKGERMVAMKVEIDPYDKANVWINGDRITDQDVEGGL